MNEESLGKIIDHAARLLPAQGPIRIFIHHNTLHAQEDNPFEQAVVDGGRRFGCRPFLDEESYRAHLVAGRIGQDDLKSVLRDDLGMRAAEWVSAGVSRFDFRLALLNGQLMKPSDSELEWYLNELPEPVDRDIWNAILDRTGSVPITPAPAVSQIRHRDILIAATGEDSDELAHPLLIRVSAAFADQGLAYWPMPARDRGLFRAFVELYRRGRLPDAWLSGFGVVLDAVAARNISAGRSILESLSRLGVPANETAEFIEETLIALRGWAGMIRQIEERPDRVLFPSPPGSLADFLAVRLLIEERAIDHVSRRHGFTGALSTVRDWARSAIPAIPAASASASGRVRAFMFYQAARLLDWTAADVRSMPVETVLSEIESFSATERRRIFHLAYERRHRVETLDALARHRAAAAAAPTPRLPAFQTIHCIDEREESFRRHLEEVEPGCATYGAAGFFGVAMYFRHSASAQAQPLCPIVVRPRHLVEEVAADADATAAARRGVLRNWVGRLEHAIHIGSLTGARGSLLTGLFGTLAIVPLFFRVFFPRQTARIREGGESWIRPPDSTRLLLEAAVPAPDGIQLGYTVDEMTSIVRRILEDIGLTAGLARLIAVVGHGSSSLNNPHESAHDCGACGGGRGGPNARAFALMANDPRVRDRLSIPPATVFVGAYHDSCNDAMEYFDIERVPETHRADLQSMMRSFDRARKLNAHERCRRFDSAPLTVTPDHAVAHVEARTNDLSQVRPEYGHATNAVAVIGRRDATRGLFMDRRSFLISYDFAADADGEILGRTLEGVGPVCAGISLEYYFSFVDSDGYGCGTKLPHNITGLIGVMDGHASDLRTGLPWQMVEIHEPVRLLMVIEAPPARILHAIGGRPSLKRLFDNRWVQAASIDPDTNAISVLRNGRFEPYQPQDMELPSARSSREWYGGRRGFLPYASIRQ